MSSANPLLGTPHIHGELLKLSIQVSQATVAEYVVRSGGTPAAAISIELVRGTVGLPLIELPSLESRPFPWQVGDPAHHRTKRRNN